jgi:hypothetical protein
MEKGAMSPNGVRTTAGVLLGHQAHSIVTDLEKSVQRSAPKPFLGNINS